MSKIKFSLFAFWRIHTHLSQLDVGNPLSKFHSNQPVFLIAHECLLLEPILDCRKQSRILQSCRKISDCFLNINGMACWRVCHES